MKIRTWIALSLVLLATLGAGCKPTEQQAAAAQQDEELGLSVRVLNYMDEPLGDVYVNGVWAGGMASHAGGFGVAGAIGLPAKWHPGQTVEVEWQDDTLYRKDRDATYKANVPVEPYDVKNDRPTDLWLAFMPGNKIRAIASSYGPGHVKFPADWKYPEKACAEDALCASKFGSKPTPQASKE
ncbi:lipoprotein [Burkholderia pseudomallei]|nr:lipoprotein [Burkholderia pseudomallei]